MSILLGVGVVTTVTILYMGKKGWQALHKVVGITPGVLTYQDPNAPLLLSTTITWQKLDFNGQHLSSLSDSQLRQLQRIDKKAAAYHNDQQNLQEQGRISAVSEEQFVLHKLLYTRLPEMLASHYRLLGFKQGLLGITSNAKASSTDDAKQAEASKLLQEALDNIERRLDILLETLETQSLQELRVMKNYLNSQN
ncbi:hypothetical protein [Psychrobacter frigidicola]|uniref:hypothetical protein n=1 Tax=Psychrobacter frigidicola TaxID=45611 RepID=UPI00191A8934|nr:hypothetical protein [Psychrobacter frigidicola]